MNRKIAIILTNDNSICAFVNNRDLPPIAPDHPNYQAIKDAIAADDVEKLIQLTDIPKSVENFASGRVEVKDGVVYYNGEAIHNGMADRILSMMREKFPFEPMLKFLENLMENPSYRARMELYDFLAHRALPITDDGCFLGYKHVRDDFMDIYSGKFDNSVGKVVEMPRNKVDDNREIGCSDGLHVGAIEYVKTYSGGGCEEGGKYIIVKVNPKDVVSVPKELECTKLRTCKYEVIGIYEGDLSGPLYTAAGVQAQPSFYDNDEDEDEDEDDYDDNWNDDPDEEDDDDDDDDDSDDDADNDSTPPSDVTQVKSDDLQGFGFIARGN